MTQTSNEPQMPDQAATAGRRRADALRRAAADKSRAAATRAETAIQHLVKDQQQINFRSVARTANVSLDFLYAHPELRPRIESLRAQQATQTPGETSEPTDTASTVTHALTVKLREERTARHTTVKQLEERLAAAHGELLRLRRLLQQHGIQP
jgi:hypothetical protein